MSDLSTGQTNLLVAGAVAQNSTPAWFPDELRIVYHAPEAYVEVIDISEGRRTPLIDGEDPTISHEEEWLAFRRDSQIFICQLFDLKGSEKPLPIGSRRRQLTSGLSWSPDGRFVSFGQVSGLIGKHIDFYLVNVKTGDVHRIENRYLRGLMLVR